MNLIIDGMHLEGFSLINWIIKSSTSVFLYHDGCNGFYSYISFFFGGFLWTWFIYLFFWNVFECNFSILLWNFHFVCYIFMHLVKVALITSLDKVQSFYFYTNFPYQSLSKYQVAHQHALEAKSKWLHFIYN